MTIYKSKLLAAARSKGIAAYPDTSGALADDFGCLYSDALGYLYAQINFCGCGLPELAAHFLIDVLALTKWRFEESKTDRFEHYQEFIKRETALFHEKRIAYFVYYALDAAELMEHGSSLPGWLTHKGEDMLEALLELKELGELDR